MNLEAVLRFLLIGLFLLSISAPLVTCSTGLERRFAGSADISVVKQEERAAVLQGGVVERGVRPVCDDPLNYIPDSNHIEHTPIRYLRLNFHFLNCSDGSCNYSGQEARRKVHEILSSARAYLEENVNMWLPQGNATPVLPTRYRYVVLGRPGEPEDDGIYFHYDDDLCYYVHKGRYRNLHDRRVIEKYGVQLDTVLNVFIMPHHPDSVVSPTYNAGRVGVALGNAVKIAGLFSSGAPGWNFSGVLNHEVGHILGLSHTWAYNDGCQDTPHHPNCWNRSDTPPCDTVISNNLMDNTAYQRAWSPCQIGRIHANLSRESAHVRRFLEPRWCAPDSGRTLVVRDEVVWAGAKDLEGDLVIGEGGALTIRCRLSMPVSAKISVYPGGKLILDGARLHNACKGQWKGIEIVSSGRRAGEVVFTADPLLEDMEHQISF